MLLLISELRTLKFHTLTEYNLLRLLDQDKFEAEQIIINFFVLEKSHSAFACILHYTFFFFKKNDNKAPQIRMLIQEQVSKF